MSLDPIQHIIELCREANNYGEHLTGQSNLLGVLSGSITVGGAVWGLMKAQYHRYRKDNAFKIEQLTNTLAWTEEKLRKKNAEHNAVKLLHDAAEARHPDTTLNRHDKELSDGNDLPAHNAVTEFLRKEGGHISSILVHQAEWALSRVNGEGKLDGLAAGEAFTTAAIVFDPSSATARRLRREAQRLLEIEGHPRRELHQIIDHLDDFAIPIEPDLPRQADEAEAEAHRRYDQNQLNLALLSAEHAVKTRIRAVGSSALTTLNVKHLQARLLELVGHSAKALEIIKEVVTKRQTMLGLAHPDTLRSQYIHALILTRLGQYDALKLIEQVIDKQKNHSGLGPYHPDTFASQHLRALLLARLGRYEDALQTIEQVAEMERNHPDLSSNHTFAVKHLHATILADLSRYDDALQITQQALDKMKKDFDYGRDHPNTISINQLHANQLHARILEDLGRYDDALQITKQVIEEKEKHPDLGPDHPSTLNSQRQHTQVLANLGRYDDALQIIERVLEKQKYHPDLGPDHQDTLGSQQHYALVLANLRRHDEALRTIEQVVEKYMNYASLAPAHPDALSSQRLHAMILFRTGSKRTGTDLASEVLREMESHPGLGPRHAETISLKQHLQEMEREMQSNPDAASSDTP